MTSATDFDDAVLREAIRQIEEDATVGVTQANWIAEQMPGYPPVNPGTPSVHDVISALHRLQEAGQVILTETTPLDATQVRLP